ncbi:Pumilio RNA-binding repeat [Dillenia turbinata]|uniref:Pumilio RNA-binding repeat n=1 Tax=Dillenia turbinata TaxID=194707 RepID=A0AAN8W1G3_9MAGN
MENRNLPVPYPQHHSLRNDIVVGVSQPPYLGNMFPPAADLVTPYYSSDETLDSLLSNLSLSDDLPYPQLVFNDSFLGDYDSWFPDSDRTRVDSLQTVRIQNVVENNLGLPRNFGVYDMNVSHNFKPQHYSSMYNHCSIRPRNFYDFRSDNSSPLHNQRVNRLQQDFKHLPLKDLKGLIVFLSKDQHWCRVLQRKFENPSVEEVELVLAEVIDHVPELMQDPFGNYLVQKLIEICDEGQRTQILASLTEIQFRLVSICLNVHGTRAVQKMLEHVTTPRQIVMVMAALRPGIVALTKDNNGHHVIQQCLKLFSAEINKYLLDEVAINCLGIATDKNGCCVLQLCMEYSQGKSRMTLMAQIVANALILSEDRYGNYVVQHMLGLRIPQITTNLLKRLQGSYVCLSQNKFGSNVVEKCLLESDEEQSAMIIMELLQSPNITMLLIDPYGNYVIQKAWGVAKGRVREGLLNVIREHSSSLRSNLYGKNILACVGRMNMYSHVQ